MDIFVMTPEDCLSAIRAGGRGRDLGARSLYDQVGGPLLRFFASQGLGVDDAKDVLQEAFLKIVRGASSYSGSGTATAWVWQVARNCLLDHHRNTSSRMTKETLFGDDEWETVADTAPTQDTYDPDFDIDACVSDGLARFRDSDPARAYVLELQMEGFPIDEIAARVGRSPGATKEYLSQCRKKISPFIAHCTALLEGR
jgi:RNA polymerase sigma factor (sigma-70 family)